jgi:hypothetical protein
VRGKVVFGVVLVLLASSMAAAQVNRYRDLPIQSTTLAVINTCQPESSGNATGWDVAPTLGSWGGVDESQFAVVWEPGFNDTPLSRMASCTIPGVSGKTAKKIKILALEGLANDDYCVFASIGPGDLLIGCKDESSATELWVTHEFDLPGGAFSPGQDIKVTILATGNAWPSFSTWGQLAIDKIEIWGE